VLNPGPALLRGRRAAQQIMQDACTITRLATSATDPETAQVVQTRTTVYSGQCRISINSKNARPQNIGEDTLFIFRVQLQLPISAIGVIPDDVATITASVYDPELVGKVFVVRELAHGTHITSRRLMVEEVIY
jgi:hypothetical protein